MKFTTPTPSPTRTTEKPQVGDVFLSKASGPKSFRTGTRYWLLASITPGRYNHEVHHLLGLNDCGEIVSTTSYGGHVARGWELVGRCHSFAGLNLKIDWSPEEAKCNA